MGALCDGGAFAFAWHPHGCGTSEIQANDFLYNPYGSGWHLDRARFDAMLAQNATQFGARVRRRERITHCKRNGDLWRLESPLHTLAANTCRLARLADAGWLAVGDAAYAVDPLSSPGIFNALEMGQHYFFFFSFACFWASGSDRIISLIESSKLIPFAIAAFSTFCIVTLSGIPRSSQ